MYILNKRFNKFIAVNIGIMEDFQIFLKITNIFNVNKCYVLNK